MRELGAMKLAFCRYSAGMSALNCGYPGELPRVIGQFWQVPAPAPALASHYLMVPAAAGIDFYGAPESGVTSLVSRVIKQ